MRENKVAVVTGSSRGIGEAVCRQLKDKGYFVYGLSRSGVAPYGCTGLKCDVTDEASVRAVFADIAGREGRIDVLVNNAGFGIAGPVEYTETDALEKQMNVNFMGQFLCAREVLQYMRKRKAGTIVFVSSVAAQIAIPYQMAYSASKAAINSMALALRNEVKDFGIRVCAVMPGDTRTSFTDLRETDHRGDEVYGRAVKSIASMEKDERNGMTPDKTAGVIVKAATDPNPAPLYTAGFKYKVFMLLFRLLPARLSYFIVSKMY